MFLTKVLCFMASQNLEILTAKEVCSFLKIKRLTLYRMMKLGEIQGFKIGRNWRFEKSAINQWIERKLEFS